MKTVYSTPNLEIVPLDEADVIATSLTVAEQKADNSEQLANDRGNPIWD